MNNDFEFDYSEEKNIWLKKTRKIDFEDVIQSIHKGHIIDDIAHFNKKKYPNQRIIFVNVYDYIYSVPYVIDRERKINFLKTIYPDRKSTKKYLLKGTKDRRKYYEK